MYLKEFQMNQIKSTVAILTSIFWLDCMLKLWYDKLKVCYCRAHGLIKAMGSAMPAIKILGILHDKN